MTANNIGAFQLFWLKKRRRKKKKKSQNPRHVTVNTTLFFGLDKNTLFTQKIEILFFSLKCSSFSAKLYAENRFQIQTIVNELHPFKILLYGVYLGVIL